MGCDIHAAIEFKDATGKWQAVLRPNKYFGKWEDEPERTARVDLNRDYDMFAILANVRNGSGFAGCDMGDGFDPMTDNRGVPEDISNEARAVLSDEHSPTWVTLLEILTYDWKRKSRHRGVVSAVEFERWDRMKEWRAAPESFCGDVGGYSVRKISEDEMRSIVGRYTNGKSGQQYQDGLKRLAKDHAHTYCQISWDESYVESGKQIWLTLLPEMIPLGLLHGYENVRLVMDFDS